MPKIAICPFCGGWGKNKGTLCPNCQGKAVWLDAFNIYYFWGKAIKPKIKAVRSASDSLKNSLKIFLAVFVLFGLILGADYSLNSEEGWGIMFLEQGSAQLFFWLSAAGILEAVVYFGKQGKPPKEIDENKKEFRFLFKGVESPKRFSVEISQFVSPPALKIITDAVELARQENQIPQPAHILKVIFGYPNTDRLLLRLEINGPSLEKDINSLLAKAPRGDYDFGAPGPNFLESLIIAFEETLIIGAKFIIPETLFLAALKNEEIGNIFKNLEVDAEDARNTVRWVLSQTRRPLGFFKAKRVKVKHRIMNRAWTARSTPMLDRASYDFTDMAKAGLTGKIIDRGGEVDSALAVLSRGVKNNVLLVGEVGSGRRTIAKAIAERIIHDDVYPSLRDRRLVVLDAAAMIAGAGAEGQLEERIIAIVNEIKSAGNIILFIPNIHNLAEAGSTHGFDASAVLAPVFTESSFQVIGSTTPNDYRKSIENRTDFANAFETVKVNELSAELSIKILSIEAGAIEAREEIILTYGAIKQAVELSKRYITDKLLPGKAIDLLSEISVATRSHRGKNTVVRDEDVMELVTRRTGIPVVKVTKDEADRLLSLEEEIHKRIVGQEQAVNAVSEAIRRVRVGLKKEHKPIGTFLFLGPTGVGKTELAKALAECYFGSEKTMLRFDMSEFQTVASIEKLIGSSIDYKVGGHLTEEVKRHPFSLVLFDELEKAHPNVLNIFLQVFDDGRLTDNLGRTVDFSNTIIIVTSNVGSKLIQESLKAGKSIDEIKPEIENKLLENFRPEFLNRFTAKIIFKSLTKEDINAIAVFQIKKLSDRLNAAQGIALNVSAGAVKKIVARGYSRAYGARNLERVIQEKIENLVATKFLTGEIKRGGIAMITESDLE